MIEKTNPVVTMKHSDSLTITFTIGDRDLIEKIQHDAHEQERSRSQIVKRIAREYYSRATKTK